MAALLIDLDGVLYTGEEPIPGASETITWLKQAGIPHLFVTNTTSRPRRAIVDKLARLGVDVGEDSILTPPVAARRWLADHVDGKIALFIAAATVEEFASLDVASPEDRSVGAVVIGDYGDNWSFAELNRAFRLLMQQPQPALVALGMTRYWQADDGLRLDTAPFVIGLAHASGAEPVVLGKPAIPFFDTALAMLGVSHGETLMIGDDIRGDVLGAQTAGLSAAQVRTGKFQPADLEGDVRPDFVLESIAELKDRWADIESRLNAGSE